MPMRRIRETVLVLAFLCAPLFGVSPVLTEAERIFSTLRSTKYSHKIFIDESRGIFDLDCSGFAAYVVGNVRPDSASELAATVAPGKRPLAKDFVNLFGAPHHNRHWAQVHQVSQLKAGDFVGWLIPPGSQSSDTGHIFIVADLPYLNANEPSEWIVPAIDSAISGHGKNDPRRKDGPNGVGQGIVGLRVDATGKPIAFRWSGGTSPVFKTTVIRMGRATRKLIP